MRRPVHCPLRAAMKIKQDSCKGFRLVLDSFVCRNYSSLFIIIIVVVVHLVWLGFILCHRGTTVEHWAQTQAWGLFATCSRAVELMTRTLRGRVMGIYECQWMRTWSHLYKACSVFLKKCAENSQLSSSMHISRLEIQLPLGCWMQWACNRYGLVFPRCCLRGLHLDRTNGRLQLSLPSLPRVLFLFMVGDLILDK